MKKGIERGGRDAATAAATECNARLANRGDHESIPAESVHADGARAVDQAGGDTAEGEALEKEHSEAARCPVERGRGVDGDAKDNTGAAVEAARIGKATAGPDDADVDGEWADQPGRIVRTGRRNRKAPWPPARHIHAGKRRGTGTFLFDCLF